MIRLIVGNKGSGKTKTLIRMTYEAVAASSGNVVCQSVIDGTDSACVPYNIFQIGGVTDEALAYLETDSYSTGSTTERVVNLSFGGDLTDYGVKTP